MNTGFLWVLYRNECVGEGETWTRVERGRVDVSGGRRQKRYTHGVHLRRVEVGGRGEVGKSGRTRGVKGKVSGSEERREVWRGPGRE